MLPGGLALRRVDQQVAVGARTQCRAGIVAVGETGALHQQGQDARAIERGEDARRFGAGGEFASGVIDGVVVARPPNRFGPGSCHPVVRSVARSVADAASDEPRVQQRHDAVAARIVQKGGDVLVVARRRPRHRLAAQHRAHQGQRGQGHRGRHVDASAALGPLAPCCWPAARNARITRAAPALGPRPSRACSAVPGVFHDRLPDTRQVLESPRVVEAEVNRLVRQSRPDRNGRPAGAFLPHRAGRSASPTPPAPRPRLRRWNRRRRRRCRRPGNTPAASGRGSSQNARPLAGQEPCLGGVVQRRRASIVPGAISAVLAVLPQADGRVAGQDLEALTRRLDHQAVVGQETESADRETRRQRGLAAPRLGDEGDRTLRDLDGAGVKHQLAELAQRPAAGPGSGRGAGMVRGPPTTSGAGKQVTSSPSAETSKSASSGKRSR